MVWLYTSVWAEQQGVLCFPSKMGPFVPTHCSGQPLTEARIFLLCLTNLTVLESPFWPGLDKEALRRQSENKALSYNHNFWPFVFLFIFFFNAVLGLKLENVTAEVVVISIASLLFLNLKVGMLTTKTCKIPELRLCSDSLKITGLEVSFLETCERRMFEVGRLCVCTHNPKQNQNRNHQKHPEKWDTKCKRELIFLIKDQNAGSELHEDFGLKLARSRSQYTELVGRRGWGK